MPCICHGAISGKEEFDKAKIKHAEKWEKALYHLKEAAHAIHTISVSAEVYPEEWYAAWSDAFSHLLEGCPENKD